MSRLNKQCLHPFYCSNHGDSGRKGHPHHKGAVWAAHYSVALTAACLGASCSTHTQAPPTQKTRVMQSNKNKLKWTQTYTPESKLHTHCHLLLPAAPWRPTRAPCLSLSLSSSLLLLTYCQVSTKQKRTSSHHTS